MSRGFCVMFDLPSEELYIRLDVLMSELRPDIVLWSTEAKTAHLFEPQFLSCAMASITM